MPNPTFFPRIIPQAVQWQESCGAQRHSLEALAGDHTSREPMGSSAPASLAPPAGGLTPRSRGLPLGLPRVPSRPRVFLNPSPARGSPLAAASTVLTTRAAARLAHLASTAPGRHGRGRRPRERCPLGPPLRPSRLSPRARVSETGLACSPRAEQPQLRACVPRPQNNRRQAPPRITGPALGQPRPTYPAHVLGPALLLAPPLFGRCSKLLSPGTSVRLRRWEPPVFADPPGSHGTPPLWLR